MLLNRKLIALLVLSVSCLVVSHSKAEHHYTRTELVTIFGTLDTSWENGIAVCSRFHGTSSIVGTKYWRGGALISRRCDDQDGQWLFNMEGGANYGISMVGIFPFVNPFAFLGGFSQQFHGREYAQVTSTYRLVAKFMHFNFHLSPHELSCQHRVFGILSTRIRRRYFAEDMSVCDARLAAMPLDCRQEALDAMFDVSSNSRPYLYLQSRRSSAFDSFYVHGGASVQANTADTLADTRSNLIRLIVTTQLSQGRRCMALRTPPL